MMARRSGPAARSAPADWRARHAAAKAIHPGCLIMHRMGDFMEFLFEDAPIAARTLDITLTSRTIGDVKVPMCGFPRHSIDRYCEILRAAGIKLAGPFE